MSAELAHSPSLPPGADAGDDVVLRSPLDDGRDEVPLQYSIVKDWILAQGMRRYDGARYLAPTTYAVMVRNVRIWMRYLAETKNDHPVASHVHDFTKWASATRKPSTVNVILESVRSCYGWAEKECRYTNIAKNAPILEDPTRAKSDVSIERAIVAGDVTKMARTILGDDLRAYRDRALIWTLWSTGVDTIALQRANVSSVDLSKGTIRLVPRWNLSRFRKRKSTADEALIEHRLCDEATTTIREYLNLRPIHKAKDPLFISTNDGSRWATLSMRLTVLRALGAAGLRKGVGQMPEHLKHYPTISDSDLADIEARLPRDPLQRDKVRALCFLVAIKPKGRNWSTLLRRAVDLEAGVIRGEGRGTSSHDIPLPPTAVTAMREWLQRLPLPADTPLFPDISGKAAERHVLRNWVWACFPERIPSRTTQGRSSSLFRTPAA